MLLEVAFRLESFPVPVDNPEDKPLVADNLLLEADTADNMEDNLRTYLDPVADNNPADMAYIPEDMLPAAFVDHLVEAFLGPVTVDHLAAFLGPVTVDHLAAFLGPAMVDHLAELPAEAEPEVVELVAVLYCPLDPYKLV
jgi:hypothetical protein